jgi:alpha,alpha-trehalose-phosphate synthase [UDP-forming]
VSAGLVVISNRLPDLRGAVSPAADRGRAVGGLVAALEPVLQRIEGIWLGWSGRTIPGETFGPPQVDLQRRPALAWVDLPGRVQELYYNGFCNRSLWPLFHSLPGSVRFEDAEWEAYRAVNAGFADAVAELVPPDFAVWCHDFHLLTLSTELLARGHRGPIGLFLHVPFPALDLLELIPWWEDLMEGMLAYDLVGFQTERDAANFRAAAKRFAGRPKRVEVRSPRRGTARVGVFPIGIIPEHFEPAEEPGPGEDASALLESLAGRRLIVGVDRLDYTKGILERLDAFGRLLGRAPEWRGRLSLVQISVPSRVDLPSYREQRLRVEAAVGRINGEYGEAHWTPVRYLYRSYRRRQLTDIYRAADVALVTPLRDGMNLVAKEFVAAQDPAHPGVLVLSRFAGAANELPDAVLTNPFHPDGMARALETALNMPLEERVARHRRLLAAVQGTTATTWAESFLAALECARSEPG